jgi:hypothetical protein
MWKIRAIVVTLSIAALGLLQGAARGGCGGNEPGVPGIEVGGEQGADWEISYQDTMKVTIKKAGAVVASHDLSVAAGGIFKLDGVDIDINKDVCQRSEIACPSEVFPKIVRMTQPGNDLHYLRMAFEKEGPLGKLTDATLLGNVDSHQAFRIELGIKAAALGSCGLLGYSYADGVIREEPNSDPLRGVEIEDGWITTAYAGGCILAGHAGAVGAGLEVEIKIPFTGKRLQSP